MSLKDSVSLIVFLWFVLQGHWEALPAEQCTCIGMGSYWLPEPGMRRDVYPAQPEFLQWTVTQFAELRQVYSTERLHQIPLWLFLRQIKTEALVIVLPLWPASYHVITPTLMKFDLRGLLLCYSENQKHFDMTTSRPKETTKWGLKFPSSPLPHFFSPCPNYCK